MNTTPACVFACLCLLSGPTQGTGTVAVTVTATGFRNGTGLCRLLVYAGSKGFPDSPDHAVVVSSGPINDKTARFTFMAMPGNYAISVLHDENRNERLDKTWVGKPKEGIGVSNNPKIRFGPPSFQESLVKLDKDNDRVLITIAYF